MRTLFFEVDEMILTRVLLYQNMDLLPFLIRRYPNIFN